MIPESLRDVFARLQPRMTSGTPRDRAAAKATWSEILSATLGNKPAAGEPTPEQQRARDEIARLSKDPEFTKKLTSYSEPAERAAITAEWESLHRAAYGAGTPALPNDPEGYAKRAREDLAMMQAGLGGEGSKRFMRALTDKSDPGHSLATQIWSESHEVGYGSEPLQGEGGVSVIGSGANKQTVRW